MNKKFSAILFFITVTGLQAQKNAALFPACHTGPLTNPQEVPVIGNGDLGAWVQVNSH